MSVYSSHEPNSPSVLPLKAPAAVSGADLANISKHAPDLTARAMELTDAWGAMFVLDADTLAMVFRAMGFSEEIVSGLYDEVVALEYVTQRSSEDVTPVFTWHGADVTGLTLRGVVGLGSAMAEISDDNVDNVLRANIQTFRNISAALPKYARHHMFSPEVASRVLAVFGAKVSPDLLYELAPRYGCLSCIDLEGRRGISTEFIRSVTLTLTSAVGTHN